MQTPHPPFRRVLVPYDGSEPSRAALRAALALVQRAEDATLIVITVVNESAAFAEPATGMYASYDPTPLIEALDRQGTALLDDATARCATAHVTPLIELVRGIPVAEIAAAIARHRADLIVIGTHARKGLARTFLGSTTEGVLRASSVPVLTVRTTDPQAPNVFATALVAVDDSDPATEAVAVAAMLARTAGTKVVTAHALDLTRLYENAGTYGFDPTELADAARSDATDAVLRALEAAGMAPDVPFRIVEGHVVPALIAAADDLRATLIVVGSHGRRGLRRLVLGSVAEGLARASDIPVLVVPTRARAADRNATTVAPKTAAAV